MSSGAAARSLLILLGAWFRIGIVPAAIAQEPRRVPADTLVVPDSLAIADSLEAEPVDLAQPFLPGVAPARAAVTPWLLELPGWRGLAIEHYNRVDGLTPSWGLRLEPVEPAAHPAVEGRIGFATTHSQLYWRAAVRQQLPLPGAIYASVEHFHRSTTFDDWKVSIPENDVATFVFASDLLDWWREKGYAIGIDGETADGRLGAALSFLAASQRSQPDRSPFALFGANYRDNPRATEGNLHSLTVSVRLDTRDIQSPLLPSPGWWLRGDAETAGGILGGELDFRRVALNLRRFSRFGDDAWWNSHVVWMGPLDGDSLPAQRHVMLGGPGSLRGFRGGSFVDSEGVQASTEVLLPLPVGRRIALLFLSWHWMVFADAGAVGDYEEWHADMGTGISGINVLSYIELLLAQRITDLDEDGSGPRFIVRFKRDL